MSKRSSRSGSQRRAPKRQAREVLEAFAAMDRQPIILAEWWTDVYRQAAAANGYALSRAQDLFIRRAFGSS